MPTYQYQCTECGEALEAQQSFTDDALTVCPVCQGRLRKVFNAVGVVFKGSGFYRNDSRAPSASSETATAGSGSKDSASSPSSASSETSSGATKKDAPASKPSGSDSAA